MSCTNTDVFSPIRNFEEEKINRLSDGFSEFLKGPDSFKKKSVNCEALENLDENTPFNKISNMRSSKTLPKKSVKSEVYKSKKDSSSASTSTHNPAFALSSEKSSSLKKDSSKNASLNSKKNDKSKTSQQGEAEHNAKNKSGSHPAPKSFVNLVKSSLQSEAAATVPTASGSIEIKKDSSSVSQRNPLSQIKSGALEKLINDAVESQADDIRQIQWSHHLNVLKAINNIEDKMDRRRAEDTTLFKIIEELLEENRQLRNALIARH